MKLLEFDVMLINGKWYSYYMKISDRDLMSCAERLYTLINSNSFIKCFNSDKTDVKSIALINTSNVVSICNIRIVDYKPDRP